MKREASSTAAHHGRGVGQKRLFNLAPTNLQVLPIHASVVGHQSTKTTNCAGALAGGWFQKGFSTAPMAYTGPIYEEEGKELAKELQAMKLKERDEIISDIHGVTDFLPNETADFLKQKLADLQEAIDINPRKLAYNQAQFLDPASVQDPELRLMMLRTDQYDAKKAAQRLINFFEMKEELFGVDKLTHSIRFEDLTPGMVKELYTCRTRISKSRDRSGRPVVVSRIEYHENDWRNHFGSIFYLFMNALKGDAEAQRKGFVVIVYDEKKSKPNKAFFSVMAKASKFFKAVPFKYTCYHYCCPHQGLGNGAISFMRHTIGKYAGFRVRTHNGSFIECVYDLMGYGIVMNMLPEGVNLSGEFDYELWATEVDKMRAEDQAKPKPQREVPNSRDVLLGRGYPYQHFVGNLYLAALIEQNRAKHVGMNRKRKTAMSTAVVNCIKEVHGGRFLRKCGGGDKDDGKDSADGIETWVEVSDKEAREKVGHGFRSPVRPELLNHDVVSKHIFCGEEVLYIRPFPSVKDSA